MIAHQVTIFNWYEGFDSGRVGSLLPPIYMSKTGKLQKIQSS